jgi:hypothetical protein
MIRPSSVAEWIGSRVPPVPANFAPFLVPGDPKAPADPSALSREAREALADSLALDPSDREAAFRLLAADGFATWACEAALEVDDPDAVLAEILDALLG